MEVLLVSYGSLGDVRPLAALGQALREKGALVRVCAPPDSRALFAATGIRFTPLGGNVRELMAARARAFVGRPWRAMAPMTRILRKELEIQFRQLPAEIGAADQVVCTGLALAAPSVAEACGVPCRYAVSIPAVLPSRSHAPLVVPWQNLPPLCNLALWWLASGLIDAAYRRLLNRHRMGLGLRPLKHVMPHITAGMMVAADRELAPLPPEAPLDCRQTGYWHAPQSGRLPRAVSAFLDKAPPPVYIGFGSMGDPAPRRTAAILRQAIRLAGTRAIVQSGWAGWSFESDSDCLCVRDDLAHEQLFPRVTAAVHHGGAGTVMAAARAGIPQVVVPHLLDQYYWGRQVQRLGIGLRPLSRNRLRADHLAGALVRIADSPRIRDRARALASPLRRRNGAREAARWLMANTGR